jgi:hypothetical protein
MADSKKVRVNYVKTLWGVTEEMGNTPEVLVIVEDAT